MHHREPANDNSQKIQPADFSFGQDPAAPQAESAPQQRRAQSGGRSQLVTAAVGGGLILALAGVFWGLPQLVEAPQVAPAATTPEQQAPAAKSGESPFSDAEVAQLRRDMQKILMDILQLREELRDRQVEIWAEEAFSAAQALAEEADAIFRQRDFARAKQQYQQALEALQTLRDSIPERLEQHLAEGNEALDRGDSEGALKAFGLVLTISEKHPRGLRGMERAERLPQAWAHFTDGKSAFAENALDKARSELQAALATDPETRAASELLPKVLAAIEERDYSTAMSAGYSALSAGDFAAARKAFLRAQKLRPDAADPAAGLAQAENSLGQNRLEQLLARASQQEQEEQWHAAAANYRKLLEADASLVSAITGRARSQARAELDDKLQELLADPLTLSESSRNQYARGVLTEARKHADKGPRIRTQVEDLEQALTRALIPMPVRLQSDSSTQVVIHHVGRLGIFSEREIALRPGRYTVVGTREGYRDVRHEFTVDPASAPPTIIIECAEKIIHANNS